MTPAAAWRSARRREQGQATVEAVAVLPVVVVVALAAGQALAARSAVAHATAAATAGAAALLQDRDPRSTAREALPGWSKDRTEIEVRGRRVTVRLEPRTVLPGVARLLTATETADAGPAT